MADDLCVAIEQQEFQHCCISQILCSQSYLLVDMSYSRCDTGTTRYLEDYS